MLYNTYHKELHLYPNKLGSLITKVIVVSADYDDLDSLEVLCGSIKGNFPHINTYEFKTESSCIENCVRLMESRCLKKFQKISFLGESRLEKDIVKHSSYIFYQKDPSSQIKFIKVSDLNIIFDLDVSSVATHEDFFVLYKFQGMLFNTDKVDYKSDSLYFECLKFLNLIDIQSFPIIIIPNHNINKACWKFAKRIRVGTVIDQSLSSDQAVQTSIENIQINQIYADKLHIRITDNMPIFHNSAYKFPSSSEIKSMKIIPSDLSEKFEKTLVVDNFWSSNDKPLFNLNLYFKIYDIISKISDRTEIMLTLEIYQSISCLK